MIIQPPAVLLEGPTGTGKTETLLTYLEAGLELFVLVTEPTGLDSLIDGLERRKLPIDKLHWHTLTPAPAGFADLITAARQVSQLSQEGLAKLGPQGDRSKPKFIDMLNVLTNFKCERTGQEFGAIDSWDDTRAFVIDSLTGISEMAWTMTIGTKPTANPGEWQIGMKQIENLNNRLTSNLKCHFCMTAHVARENDEVSGAQKIMTLTLGSKLAPKIPPFYSEVILSRREGTEFFWSNTFPNVDLKKRALPFGDKLLPSFVPIVEAYKKRKEKAAQQPKPETQQEPKT